MRFELLVSLCLEHPRVRMGDMAATAPLPEQQLRTTSYTLGAIVEIWAHSIRHGDSVAASILIQGIAHLFERDAIRAIGRTDFIDTVVVDALLPSASRIGWIEQELAIAAATAAFAVRVSKHGDLADYWILRMSEGMTDIGRHLVAQNPPLFDSEGVVNAAVEELAYRTLSDGKNPRLTAFIDNYAAYLFHRSIAKLKAGHLATDRPALNSIEEFGKLLARRVSKDSTGQLDTFLDGYVLSVLRECHDESAKLEPRPEYPRNCLPNQVSEALQEVAFACMDHGNMPSLGVTLSAISSIATAKFPDSIDTAVWSLTEVLKFAANPDHRGELDLPKILRVWLGCIAHLPRQIAQIPREHDEREFLPGRVDAARQIATEILEHLTRSGQIALTVDRSVGNTTGDVREGSTSDWNAELKALRDQVEETFSAFDRVLQ